MRFTRALCHCRCESTLPGCRKTLTAAPPALELDDKGSWQKPAALLLAPDRFVGQSAAVVNNGVDLRKHWAVDLAASKTAKPSPHSNCLSDCCGLEISLAVACLMSFVGMMQHASPPAEVGVRRAVLVDSVSDRCLCCLLRLSSIMVGIAGWLTTSFNMCAAGWRK